MSIGILGVEWTRHLELKKQTLSQESGNTNYIEKRDKTVEKPKKIKTKYDKKDPTSKSINKYLEKTQFNGTVAVFDNGKVKMNKGYGYQDIEKGKKEHCKYNVFNRISAKIYNRFNAEAT